MFKSNYFTTNERVKINKCLIVMEKLAENDGYFADALEEFNLATGKEQRAMGDYLLRIYSDWKENSCFSSLEQAIILSAYPA